MRRVASTPRRPRPIPFPRHLALDLLLSTSLALIAGGALHLVGAGRAGHLAWIVTGACGAAYSLWSVVDGLRRGRLGVDLVAMLALIGALAVGDYLAGAVISVMVASRRMLESWAAGRITRDPHQSLGKRTPAEVRTETLAQVQRDAIEQPECQPGWGYYSRIPGSASRVRAEPSSRGCRRLRSRTLHNNSPC
jgi:cation transport ATPase